MQRGVLFAIAAEFGNSVLLIERDARGSGTVCLPFGPSTKRLPPEGVILTPFGSGISFFPNS